MHSHKSICIHQKHHLANYRSLLLGSWSPPAAPLSPDAPERASHLPPESAYFLAANRNKRSIGINFKKPEGLAIIHKLVEKSDVLVENYIPGKLASMGLGYDDCRKINDGLIYTSITGLYYLSTPSIVHFI